MPGFSADFFLNFLGLCVSRGSPVAESSEELVDHEIGAQSLEQLWELAALLPEEIYGMNPITLYERMSSEDKIAYCPFAYTYSNYSREGFAPRRIRFSNPVALDANVPMRTVLGGTGIAISANCREAGLALQYGLFVAGRTCQRTLYGLAGGQPARRSAWRDPILNQISDAFFSRTADSMERAWVRPRYQGYVGHQERAGEVLVECCRNGGKVRQVLERIDTLYRSGLNKGVAHV
jgi:multiple sugar transport system substrate-binding protein